MTDYTEHWQDLRDKRNRKLEGTDWIMLPDSPFTDEERTQWRTYRQALRDMMNVDLPDGQNESQVNPLTLLSFPAKPSS